MLKVLVYCSRQNHFEVQKKHLLESGFLNDEIIFADANSSTRESCINAHLNNWLLFLDHDCFVKPETKSLVLKWISQTEKRPVVFAGRYSNPREACALQRAHNLIANTWLSHSHSSIAHVPLVLGGAFLVYAGHEVKVPEVKFWGGEDKLLAVHLNEKGYDFVLQNGFEVTHDTSPSLSHFLRRAYLHGKNDALYFSKENKVKTSYWIQKIDFSDVSSASLILLHFCIQRAAKWIQKALPMNKR
jgi:GT2 family glycosyltransferase